MVKIFALTVCYKYWPFKVVKFSENPNTNEARMKIYSTLVIVVIHTRYLQCIYCIDVFRWDRSVVAVASVAAQRWRRRRRRGHKLGNVRLLLPVCECVFFFTCRQEEENNKDAYTHTYKRV